MGILDLLADGAPTFSGNLASHKTGDVVRTKDGALAMVLQTRSKLGLVPLSSANEPDMVAYVNRLSHVREHQRLVSADWPATTDQSFHERLHAVLRSSGVEPPPPSVEAAVDPDACKKATSSRDMTLQYYQQIAGLYLVYSPTRALLVNHSMGSGKTCTAIHAMDRFIAYTALETEMENFRDPVAPKKKAKGKTRVFFVIPPRASLKENMRGELQRCPGKLKGIIEARQANLTPEQASLLASREINKNVNIISYVTLSNRLKRKEETLEGSLVIMDEAHNFLSPPAQYKSQYEYLYGAVRSTKDVKLMLMTGTPIHSKVTDLSRLINLTRAHTEPLMPENEAEFMKTYFSGGKMDEAKVSRELKGAVSFYDVSKDTSYFATKEFLAPVITHIVDTHHERWSTVHERERAKYDLPKGYTVDDMVSTTNAKFKGKDGYFKQSSAANNVPMNVRSDLPAKFAAVTEQLNAYPKEKHFVYSRHAGQGSNAMGLHLQQAGWDRMSDNRRDHGTARATLALVADYNPIAAEMAKIKDSDKVGRKSVIDSRVKKPYMGFVVLNKNSTVKAVSDARNCFNDRDNNIDGRVIRVFIADESLGEGLSLNNTTHVHLIEPPHSAQAFQQIIARAVRKCSHQDMPYPWTVKVHKYIARHGEEHLTDDMMDKYSSGAQGSLEQLMDSMEKNAIEHGFKPRNKNDHVESWTAFLNAMSDAAPGSLVNARTLPRSSSQPTNTSAAKSERATKAHLKAQQKAPSSPAKTSAAKQQKAPSSPVKKSERAKHLYVSPNRCKNTAKNMYFDPKSRTPTGQGLCARGQKVGDKVTHNGQQWVVAMTEAGKKRWRKVKGLPI